MKKKPTTRHHRKRIGKKKKQQWLPIPKNQDVEVWNRKTKSMKKILKNKVPAKSDEAIKKLVSRIIQTR